MSILERVMRKWIVQGKCPWNCKWIQEIQNKKKNWTSIQDLNRKINKGELEERNLAVEIFCPVPEDKKKK